MEHELLRVLPVWAQVSKGACSWASSPDKAGVGWLLVLPSLFLSICSSGGSGQHTFSSQLSETKKHISPKLLSPHWDSNQENWYYSKCADRAPVSKTESEKLKIEKTKAVLSVASQGRHLCTALWCSWTMLKYSLRRNSLLHISYCENDRET